MAQRKSFDRFAQMEKQQELIAKKRREILEKQRTVELAKAVAASMKDSMKEANDSAAASDNSKEEEKTLEKVEESSANVPNTTTQRNSLIGKTGKMSFGLKRTHPSTIATAEPPPKLQNTFCNDGSFLDHFKKILESQKPKIVPPVENPTPAEVEATTESEQNESDETSVVEQQQIPPQLQAPPLQAPPPAPAPPPVSVAMPIPPQPPTFAFNPNFLPQGMLIPQQQPPEQPPPMPAAFFSAHFANFTPSQLPPPPPPPQIPISLANQLANLAPLYMIPAPEPIQISTIQAPKEFDLNAIPKPQLNLEAIQVPASSDHFSMMSTTLQSSDPQQQQQQQHDEQQQQRSHLENDNVDNHNCPLPTTLDSLIDLVADNGDEYEDKIRTQKNQLHPAMWFLFDKHCQQYQEYRQQLNMELQRRMHHQQHKQLQQQLYCNENTSQDRYDPDENESADKYDPETALGGEADSDEEYMQEMQDRNREQLRQRIEDRKEESDGESDAPERAAEKRRKQRRSRWGEKVQNEESNTSNSEAATSSNLTSFGNQNKPMLSAITRSDPGLLQYARLNYGSTNLSEEDWKKCEEHYKVNLLYQDMMRKRQEIDRLARSGKFKYEYDSDEDVDGGTWEHKLRTAEMEATQAWASALTKQSEGKHHIGDFLPPEELKKFMEQYEAKKSNRQPDLSDYKEYKLREDNIGFQMLQKLGWKEGQGLGQDGAGIVDPVNKGPQRDGNQGLGVSSVAPEDCDNEYDAYRKRMMLAYRFRPNPLNNPRRAYY